MAAPRIVHVPIPLSTAGSSVTTVVRHLATADQRTGGRPAVILSRERDVRVDDADNEYVSYSTFCPREWFTRRELALDHVMGALGRGRPYTARMFRPAVERLCDLAADAVVVHEGHYATGSIREWRRLWAGPLVLYVHTPISRAYRTRELRRLLESASHLVFVSNTLRERTMDRVPRLHTPTSVIHNALDHATFHSRDRTEPSGVLRVTYAGQVAEHKGVMEFLQACARVTTPLLIRVVGSSSHQAGLGLSDYEIELRVFSQAHSLPVEFVPYVGRHELAGMLRQTDVVCVPSLWQEPFGMIALEAMGSGTAVIASAIGGLPEACDGAATLIDPKDVRQFAQAIQALADPLVLAEAQARSIARAQRANWESAFASLRQVVACPVPA